MDIEVFSPSAALIGNLSREKRREEEEANMLSGMGKGCLLNMVTAEKVQVACIVCHSCTADNSLVLAGPRHSDVLACTSAEGFSGASGGEDRYI